MFTVFHARPILRNLPLVFSCQVDMVCRETSSIITAPWEVLLPNLSFLFPVVLQMCFAPGLLWQDGCSGSTHLIFTPEHQSTKGEESFQTSLLPEGNVSQTPSTDFLLYLTGQIWAMAIPCWEAAWGKEYPVPPKANWRSYF